MKTNKARLLNYLFCITSFIAPSWALALNNQTQSSLNNWEWQCTTLQTQDLYKHKITWQTLNCDGSIRGKKILADLHINIVSAKLDDPDIKILPYNAQTPNQLAKLPDIANSIIQYQVLAGINGGYFYRSDVPNFKDNICYYKTFNPPGPDDSIGDSLLQYNGQNYATNCAFLPDSAKNPRAALILTGTDDHSGKNAPYITLVDPDVTYTQANQVIPDAIGAGPNLVTDGHLTVNNPNEDLLPTLEFAANSAVGIINGANGQPAELLLFTVDGNNDAIGMDAFEMGDFMLNYLHVHNAMSMDQGGSTTLYVAASDPARYPLHVVSNSHYEPGVPPDQNQVRNIYDGLFIAIPFMKS